MRKRAQEQKRSPSPSSSSSSLTYENSPMGNPPLMLGGAENWSHIQNNMLSRITASTSASVTSKEMNHEPGVMHAYPMEQIWRDIEKSEAKVAAPSCQGNQTGACWDYCFAESLLRMENELKKLFLPPVQMGGFFC
jgi:hypothetical protein